MATAELQTNDICIPGVPGAITLGAPAAMERTGALPGLDTRHFHSPASGPPCIDTLESPPSLFLLTPHPWLSLPSTPCPPVPSDPCPLSSSNVSPPLGLYTSQLPQAPS